MYSSAVSSHLIRLPDKRILKRFEDLYGNNYSAALSKDEAGGYQQAVSSMVSNETGTWANFGLIHLKKLISYKVIGASSHLYQLGMAQFLVTNHSSQVFYTSLWYIPMYLFN